MNDLWIEIVKMCSALRTSDVEHYREFTLRLGGKKRAICCPLNDLKSLQTQVLKEVLYISAPHSAATAYRPGLSIAHNARMHQGCAFLLKTDVQGFFNSIRSERLLHQMRDRYAFLPKESIRLIGELCTYRGSLPQGAPTSPHLSNIFMWQFDENISSRANDLGVRYTRYADDIAVSGSNERHVLALGYDISVELETLGLSQNLSKTRFLRPGAQKIVTGLDVSLQTIRPTRKFRKSTMALIRVLKVQKKIVLRRPIEGRLAFWNSINPRDPQLTAARRSFESLMQEISKKAGTCTVNLDFLAKPMIDAPNCHRG